MNDFSKIENKNIILDTNILINCGRDEFGVDFKKVLKGLTNRHNSIMVSVISGFEIVKQYREGPVSDYYLKLLNFLRNIPLDLDVLNRAGIIANEIYKNKGGDNKYKDDYDIIIGSTAISLKNDCLVLTCDRRGFFTAPFWEVVARECVYWEDKQTGIMKIENIFLLRHNSKKITNILKNEKTELLPEKRD